MRFLIITSAILACAYTAPSGVAVAPAVVVAAAPAPTIPSGDLEAAAIDAKVQAEDRARYLADQSRLLAEKSAEDTKEKLIEGDSQIQEQTQETFWSNEDKKWQAYDALKTAEAQLDGNAAAAAPILAKSVVNGAVLFPTTPFVAPLGFISKFEEPKPELAVKSADLNQNAEKEKQLNAAPLFTPVPYIVPGIMAPALNKFEETKPELATKTPQKFEEKIKDSKFEPKPTIALSALPPQFLTPFSFAPNLKFEPWLTPITTFIHPSTVTQFQAPILTAYVK